MRNGAHTNRGLYRLESGRPLHSRFTIPSLAFVPRSLKFVTFGVLWAIALSLLLLALPKGSNTPSNALPAGAPIPKSSSDVGGISFGPIGGLGSS